MATIDITGDAVEISLTPFEKIAGLLRDQRIDLETIDALTVEDDPQRPIRGLRAPGLGVPFGTKIGTWRGGGRRLFVCVRGRQPAVRIDPAAGAGAPYDAYVVSVDDPHAVVAAFDHARSRN